MIALLLVCLTRAEAGTLAAAQDALWEDPVDLSARLAFAEALAATPGREEEGVEALRFLLGAPTEGPIAREVLGEMIRQHPPRRGWIGLYAELARGPEGPARDAARVRAAQVRATAPGGSARSRREAVAELRALGAAGEGLANVVLGDVLFESGDAAGARSAWLRAPAAVGAQRVALAALALGDPEEAERERQRALAAGAKREDGLGGAFAIAVTTNSPVAQAQALLEAGFPHAAERILLAAVGRSDAGAAAVAALLGDLRLARGDGAGAASAYTEALERDATPENRAKLVRALVASGRPDDATAALATGPVPVADRGALEASLGFSRALATPTLDDDLPAAAAAFAAAPGEPGTAATYGRLLAAAGRDADALAPLARALGLRPDDDETRGRLLAAAVRVGDARALDAAAGALAFATDDASRRARVDTLAGLLLASGDAQKAAGSPATARTSALVAFSVRPDTPAVLHAVGGLLWQDRRNEAALALYTRAANLDPFDVDARVNAAQLAMSLGREDEVKYWLASLPKADPRVVSLRDEMSRESQARAARTETDLPLAEARWKVLIERWPGDARFLHGLADVYLRLGRLPESLAIQRAAATIAPDDPWNKLGVIQALLALGRTAEAIEALDALPKDVPLGVSRERDHLRALLAREEGDAARAAGDTAAALLRYEASYALEADVWTSIALAGTLVASGNPKAGLERFREVLVAHGEDPDVDTVASRGEAGALEALGEAPAALVVLESLAARRPDAETDEQLDELRARIAVGEADALRRAGRFREAEAALQVLAVEVGNQPMVQAAWAALLLDLRRPADAVIAATRALQREPRNQWALDVARAAGRKCRCSERVVPLFRVALASGGDPALRADLQRVKVAAATELALASRAKRRPVAARDALKHAATLARGDAPSLVILSEGETAFGHTGHARRALRQALDLDPVNREATLAVAADLAERGRWRKAVALAERTWEAGADPEVGALLARLRADPPGRKGGSAVASTAPGVASPGGSAGAPGTDPAPGHAADVMADPGAEAPKMGPLPPGPPDAMPTTPLPKRAPGAGPIATVGFGVLRRSGVAGVGQELATYVPIHIGPPPTGPVQLDIEAVLLRVENGVDTSWGIAPTVGIRTPSEHPWGAWARLGMSPLGGEAPAYPVWHLGGRGRLGLPLAFGIETGRAPVLDSYASWVGAADLYTGEPFGRVHHTWMGAWAGLGAPWGTDLGLLGRLGQSEGIGLEPVGRAELVAWLGQRIGTPENNVRIGGEGVAFSHQYQVDGFQSGQGAFYSPPIFGVATGRVDVRIHTLKDRLGICGGVGAGMQYAGGGTSLYFAPGSAFTHNGRLSVEWNVGGAWGIAVQGGWLKAGPWHQETGLLRFGHNLGGPPPLTTFATPSAGLLFQGEPC